ncbi:family 43 glycosylhydrolase [Paenibacillus lutimineralis]|uniref:1,4-beta-xylanase n=1 Tax=Paenibacillus lutimineralis TaxID=2707005 RepID=A0A3Q9I9P7_9BACL|nr:family 43 glycosylhydrolase [Paenibacillus lutimineralis]AZS14321.1 1,4-beta-xylanase [Paenibacillus lutimineralis]
MLYLCNPLNIDYRYQFIDEDGKLVVNREAADPSLVLFKDRYYMFLSMTGGFLVSDDLVDWTFHALRGVPIYDYAPDARVMGDNLILSASHLSRKGSFYRATDPIEGEFEEMAGTFPFWDPHLFVDDDGKVYFYWGCSNYQPIYGVQLDPVIMQPLGEPQAMISGNPARHGYERNGEDHFPSKTKEQIEQQVQLTASKLPKLTEEIMDTLRVMLGNDPFIEGAWMNKHDGVYYLQYASPGTEYNVYSDGVYVSDHPLGPFKLAQNNPYSYKPGGFTPGAGHGSTMSDRFGNLWHASTMRISVNQQFERRVGLWPAGFDSDGELFCNQRFGDWPMKIAQERVDPWADPEWMMLSYGKSAGASSYIEGYEPAKATDENVRTWWKAANPTPDQWVEVDLQQEYDVHAIQINFADDQLSVDLPEGATLQPCGLLSRYIDMRQHHTRWILEGSLDGQNYFVIEDKLEAMTNLPHDLIVREAGFRARYIRCTVRELPYGQIPCVSGLRVFGAGDGSLPDRTTGVRIERLGELDLHVVWNRDQAVGHNVLWGYAPDKLYHSYMILGSSHAKIGALIRDQPVYVRVDAFNERGIVEGEVYLVV